MLPGTPGRPLTKILAQLRTGASLFFRSVHGRQDADECLDGRLEAGKRRAGFVSSLNRLTQSTDGAGNAAGYAYDLDGNLTTLTYPGGAQVTRSYDHASRLNGITDWLHSTTNFAYDADGNPTLQTYPNSTTAGRTFNAADQLTKIVDSRSGVPFLTFAYGRDSVGQLSWANDPLDTLQHTYGYDALNRLTNDARTAGTTSWGYDKADQLTSITDPTSGTSTLGYDVAHELTGLAVALNGVTTKNLTLTYNSSGDRTGQSESISGSSAGFGYDQANRLTSYSAGGTSATYAYNGDGLRLSKTVGGTTGHEVWDLAEGLPLMLSDGTNSYVSGADGLPLEQITGSSVTYLYQDQLGSTRGLLDGSGPSWEPTPMGRLAMSGRIQERQPRRLDMPGNTPTASPGCSTCEHGTTIPAASSS